MKKTHETIFVDFKEKKVVKTIKKTFKNPYNFDHFNPVPKDCNFSDYSDKDRYEYSEHVLKHIREVSFEDLSYWVSMGMLDVKKLNKALGIDNALARKKLNKR